MGLIKIEDISSNLDESSFKGAIEEEVDSLNQAISEAVVTMNQSVEAVRRLIIVRDALASSTVEQ